MEAIAIEVLYIPASYNVEKLHHFVDYLNPIETAASKLRDEQKCQSSVVHLFNSLRKQIIYYIAVDFYKPNSGQIPMHILYCVPA